MIVVCARDDSVTSASIKDKGHRILVIRIQRYLCRGKWRHIYVALHLLHSFIWVELVPGR